MNNLFSIVDENLQFYPTPDWLIDKMIAKISKEEVSRILEPSAGDGRILDKLKDLYEYGRSEFFVIEKDFNLQKLLIGKGYKLIDSDFLKYKGGDIFDVIIGNPPFKEGAKHLLKAIDIMIKGEIIFLLNAETIRNPYTNERKLLLRKIKELNGEIEFYDFKGAERKANVKVALIYIKKEYSYKDWFLKGLKKEKFEESIFEEKENKDLVKERGIEFLVKDYEITKERGLKFLRMYFENFNRFKLFFFGDKYNSFNCSYRNKIIAFLRDLKIVYWKKVADLPEVTRRLTDDKRKEFESLRDKFSEMEFSETNIRQFILNVIENYKVYIKEAIIDVFDMLTRRYAYKNSKYLEEKNIHYFNGWKTNKAFKVNKKVIIPVRTIDWSGRFHISEYDDGRKLLDIDKVMDYFDTGGKGVFLSIVDACNYAFEKGITKNIHSTFFKIDAYKKGTLHLTFLDDDLLRRFNLFVCIEKNWLPFDYGRKEYNKMNNEEKKIVEEFEGKENYKPVKDLLKLEYKGV